MDWLRINSNGVVAALAPARAEAEEFFGSLSPSHYELLSEWNAVLDIIPRHTHLAEIPGYRWIRPADLGGTRAISLHPCGNTLRFACDERYFLYPRKRACVRDYDYLPRHALIHEGAHVVHNATIPSKVNNRLCRLFVDRFKSRKVWVTSYAGKNYREYFAESVCAFWNAPAHPKDAKRCSRAWLRRNDPEMFELLLSIFPGATLLGV